MSATPITAGRVRTVIRAYARETVRFPWLLTLLLIGTIGIQAADLASPVYLRQFFNVLAANVPSSAAVGQLLTILVSIAVVSFGGWLSRRVHIFCLTYIESRVMSNLYDSSFFYLIRHSYHFFTSQFTGTLTRRVSKFAAAYETIMDGTMMQFFPTALFMVGVVTVLFLRNNVLGLILAGWTVCFVGFQVFVAKLRQPLRTARAEEDSKMVGALSDAISNQNTIALFTGLRFERERFREVIGCWRAATIRSWNADELIWSAQGLLMVVINVGLLYGAIRYWQQGLLTVGDFVLIQTYLIGSFDRLLEINRGLRRFYDAFADAGEMMDILQKPHDIQDRPKASELKPGQCEIVLRDVDFYFHETRKVLANLNLTVRGGEKLALVGPSGAGKSTITKLLLRLYDIAGGSIEIDGQNIAAVTQESLRAAIAFVPQEPILFHRTLMDNIRYGRRDATDEEVVAAAKKAHCHEFITGLPDGYGTYVGERGIKLSGGERQRVAIARAILKDAPILLLDEATSSLDSESEALIQDALQTLMQGKTVIVIAHRLSTIMKMDRIVVIDNGHIVAEGTHQELLKHGGLYHKLWSIQAGGFITDQSE